MSEEYQFNRAYGLRIKLELELNSKTDVLGDYRKWLDDNGINSETDGFPSEEAYIRVDDYIKELLDKNKKTKKHRCNCKSMSKLAKYGASGLSSLKRWKPCPIHHNNPLT